MASSVPGLSGVFRRVASTSTAPNAPASAKDESADTSGSVHPGFLRKQLACDALRLSKVARREQSAIVLLFGPERRREPSRCFSAKTSLKTIKGFINKRIPIVDCIQDAMMPCVKFSEIAAITMKQFQLPCESTEPRRPEKHQVPAGASNTSALCLNELQLPSTKDAGILGIKPRGQTVCASTGALQ